MERIELLKKQLFDGFFIKREWWGDDLTVLDRPGVHNEPLSMRKALAFEKVCNEMPIETKDHELIVGMAAMSSVGYGHMFPKYETDEEAERFGKISLNRKSVWGHHLPYYPMILEEGYQGIISRLDEAIDNTPAGDTKTLEFYRASRHCLNAAAELPRRYSALLTCLAESEKSGRRKAELFEIARVCERVPMFPASSFQEALQSVWFVHMLLHSTLSYTPLGRVDQYLWPYYDKDIRTGKITKDYARDLIASFLIKFNERFQFNQEHMENHLTDGDWSQGGDPDEPTTTFDMSNDQAYTFGQSANHWLQSAIVGGLGPDGKDAANELSYLFVEVINRLELVSPMLGARIHKGSPPDFLRYVASALSQGGAQPVLFNDDVIVKGLIERLGIPAEDACDYSSDGCWEVLVYGKTEYSYGHIELLLCMEALINDGRSLIDGRILGKEMTGIGEIGSFEEFYSTYIDQVKYRIDAALSNKLKYYDQVHKIAPEPYLSALVLDCIKNGRDLTDKGARYRIYSVMLTGLSHAIDSLSMVKKLVYGQKLITLNQAIAAVKANWEGYEDIRQIALTKTPKYGNDDPESDALLNRFFKDVCGYCDKWNEKIDWIVVSAGVATFENYPRFGHNAGASFDGRYRHEAISSNYSPAVGRDASGPTAVMLSSTKFDLSRLNSGCPVDMVVSFSKEDEDENCEILLGLIKSFIDLSGNILTLTKVDNELLKKAQERPEDYISLRVRLGGVTAYFVQLARPQQDEYMRRTGHKVT